MDPPGNCSPGDQQRMQNDVNRACKQPRSCRGISDPIQAIVRREINRECAMARDKINNKCFAGGDKDHRNQAIDAWNSLVDCEKIIP
jgi:type VI secretion system secreted protein VgrG